MDANLRVEAAEIAAHAERELPALVGVSSPSGDHPGAEEAVAICTALLPVEAEVERLPCSTTGAPDDLLARIAGTGSRRILLLGHLDTVFPHGDHVAPRREGERLYGSGTADMKGGVALSLGLLRALARRPHSFAELTLLLVNDEEWRTEPFGHVERFAGYDACLCFEAGERTAQDEEAVVVKRKAAGTLIVTAAGRAAHSGSAPDAGRNALLALARMSLTLAEHHDPHGPERLSVVPTVLAAGGALNVVPAHGELTLDMRADRLEAFQAVRAAVAEELDEVALEARMGRQWPGMDAREATAPLLEGASQRLGRPIRPAHRGGASDAAHFAAAIPLTIDGLGPRGGGAHTPGEFIHLPSLLERAEVALAIAEEALQGS